MTHPPKDAPKFAYWSNFVAWDAYTSPTQLNVELSIVVVELVVVWGIVGFLLARAGVADSPFAPLLPVSDVASYSLQHPPGARTLFYLAWVSLGINVIAVVLVLVYWFWLAVRRCRSRSDAAPHRRPLANLLFLWVTNAAGAAELLLVNPYLGPPSAVMDEGQSEQLQDIARIYF